MADWASFLQNANSWLGVPYRYGGTTRAGVDCSGLIEQLFAAVGVNTGRDTTAQMETGQVVGQDGNWNLDVNLLQPGDVLYYGTSGPNAHAAMYLGGGQVLQAPSTGHVVDIVPLFQSASPTEQFAGVRRFTSFIGAAMAGGVLSAGQVLAAAQAGGFTGDAALQAVAYAYIESGFNASAVSSTGCSGLWQLCPPPPNWQDPVTNARGAFAKWSSCRGGSFACDWDPYDGGQSNPAWHTGYTMAQQAAAGGGVSLAASGGQGQQQGPLTQADVARLRYMALGATFGPDILDPTSATSQALNQPQTQAQLTSWWNPLDWITNPLKFGEWIGSGGQTGSAGPVGSIIGGAETIAGILGWITKPVNILRALEVLAGGVLMGIGLAMYVDILVPGIGGVIGTVAGAMPAGRATKAVAGARTQAVRAQEVSSRELRATTSQIRAERSHIRALQPSGGPSRGPSARRGPNPGRIIHEGTRAFNEFGEEMFG